MIKKILQKLKSYQYKNFPFRIYIYVAILFVVGILSINSATGETSFGQKQIMGLMISLVLMIILSLMDYHFILKFYWVFYVLNLLLLLYVRFFGDDHLGAQRWIDLGGFQLQPSEFTKILLIFFFAMIVQKHKEKLNTFRFLATSGVLLLIPTFLILKQPDLSTTIVIVLTFCAIIFISGLSGKFIGIIFAIAVPVTAILVYLVLQPNQSILQDYQYNRIVGFFDETNEDAAQYRYQQENSILAIGSGGLYGKGLNNNTITSVKNGNYLDEAHTDFIFTIIGEELGFVGTFSVIILLALVVVELFILGSRAPDLSGRLVCCGLASLIAIQSIINISVVTMLIPNTGLTLPFVSYGLNSILSLFIGLGVVNNICFQRKHNHYEEEEDILRL